MKTLAQFIVFCLSTVSVLAGDGDSLRQAFSQPPDNARIMVRWWWFGPAVTQPELEREMRMMKQGGIGGFEVQPVYPLALDGQYPGLKNLKFLSPEFLDDLRFVAAKAKALGLRMDLTLGSGWPYGGPQFRAAESAAALTRQSLPITPGALRVPRPRLPQNQALIAAFVKVGDGYEQVPVTKDALEIPANAASATAVELYLQREEIMRVKRPAVGAEGQVIDHYAAGAVDKFLREIAAPEVEACGPNPPYSLFCDSLEVSGENWTPDLLAEFRRRRGYDLEPLLPGLFHDLGPKSVELRRDWGKTVTELFNENFIRRMAAFAHAHRSRFRIQAYGTPPAGLYSYADADLPEGEGFHWQGFSATRWSASAVHLLGQNVASSETFTWLHGLVFRATPLDIKAEADRHFLSGINQLICHGWPYTAEGVPNPGWSFYAAGVFDEKNPWWLVMPDVGRYLQRVSSVLRQGQPANDVAVYLPNDDAWTDLGRGFSLSSALATKVTGLSAALTEAGYGFDYFDDPLLTARGRTEGSSLAFGSLRYPVVVLPAVERMPLTSLKMLESFAQGGGILIALGRLPDLAPGYSTPQSETDQVRAIVQRLFRAPGAPGIFVPDETQLGAVLLHRLGPDFRTAPEAAEVGFIHRHTDAGEIYFVANTGNKTRHVNASFRTTGLVPEIWNPLTAQVERARRVSARPGVTTLALDLAPYGSTLVALLRQGSFGPGVGDVDNITAMAGAEHPAPSPPLDLSRGWTVRFGQDASAVAMDRLQSWSEIPERRHFSGVASYARRFTVSPDLLRTARHWWLDLGPGAPLGSLGDRGAGFHADLAAPVREAAVVYLNEQRIGSIWAPPYAVEVTGRLVAGENRLRIEVANLATNALADQPFPNYDNSGVTRAYGDRFPAPRPGAMQVLPAGLLGPVRLVSCPPGTTVAPVAP